MAVKRKQSICHCINLRRSANALTAFYDRALSGAGLTVNQFSLLVNIGRSQPVSISALAAQVGLDRSTLARTLKPLLAEGLIADGAEAGERNRQLGLTAKGRARLKTALPNWEKAQRDVEAALGRTGLAKLTSLLAIIDEL